MQDAASPGSAGFGLTDSPTGPRRGYLSLAWKLGAYGMTTAVSLVAQVAAIPLLISAVGPHPWAGIALGQAVGSVAGLVVQGGWSVTGPTEVAMAGDERRQLIYAQSALVRGVGFIPVALIAAGVCALVGGSEWAIMLSAVAAAANGLSPSWFLVGISRPFYFFMAESVPRAVGTVGGAVAVAVGAPLVVFPIAQLVACLATFVVVSINFIQMRLRDVWRSIDSAVLREQVPGLTQSLVQSSYKYLPLIVVSALTPAAAPVYALGDRLLKLSVAGMRPMTQVLQGWVPAAKSPEVFAHRARVARAGNLAVSGMSAVLFATLAPTAGDLLSHGKISISYPLAAMLGLAFGLALASATTGLVFLVSLGLKRYLAASAVVGAVVGIVTIWPAVILWAAFGAGLSVACSELAVQTYQTWKLRQAGWPHRLGVDHLETEPT